ncbi:MAG: type II toxin-antitoxin system RelE/ParE family toxin [Nitrospinota bacterium]|nr:type II toxin-antitoxin system RelE/ParE family toxin [Nitrospinota bacterium]
MPRVELRPKALQDLEDIWHFTLENWGEDQADQYILDMNDGFESLADHPRKGPSCDDIREGYRKYNIGRHIVFYRTISQGIEIVRILHQSMDPDRHLK